MADKAQNQEPESATPTTTSLSLAQEQISRWRSVIDSVRSRADLTAKALAAVATTAITAIGIDKLRDISPSDWDVSTLVWAALALAGFLTLAGVVAAFIRRLAKVNAPVVVSTRRPELGELDAAERTLVDEVFGDMADLNQARSLRAYEARAHRLDRIAQRSVPERRKELEEQATRIRTEVQATLGRAAADVVRWRNAQAFVGPWARSMYVLAITGFVLFAIGTDYLDGERVGRNEIRKAELALDKQVQDLRKGRVGIVKDCADAFKGYGEREELPILSPTTCPRTRPAQPPATGATPGTTPGAEAAGVLADIAERLVACRSAVKVSPQGVPDPTDVARCDRIQRVLAQAARTVRQS